MTRKPVVRSLGVLVELRELAADRLAADLARQATERDRYLANLVRLDAFARTEAPAAGVSLHPALAVNQAGYRQVVHRLAEAHRADLARHEAEMAATRRSLAAADQRRQALERVLALENARHAAGERRVEQSRQDEMGARARRDEGGAR